MRRSVIAPSVLIRDVIAQYRSCDTWRAIRVEVGVGACLSDLSSGDGGDGAAETVSYDDDAVGWVTRSDGVECGENAGAGFEPAVVAGWLLAFTSFLV